MESDDSDKEKKISSNASFTEPTASSQQTGSSVWNLCDTQAVDLRDITPSISPVFTEDQVRELSGQTGDLDVLGDNFLPHIKRITEVLSPEQTNLIISTCTSLCSESDGLSYSHPVVGSIGHFVSQHDPVLNSPPEKTSTTHNATPETTKSGEVGQSEAKHLSKPSESADSGTVKCADGIKTKADAQDSKDNTNKEPVQTKENKSKNDKIKSTYTLRSSPRKAAREEKNTAENTAKNTRQKNKKDVKESERRKSPRGQKQISDKDDTSVAHEKKSPGKKGKQKEEQNQPESNSKEENKKDEGMSLRRSSRIQKHDISPAKHTIQSPRKGRGAKKKILTEESDAKANQTETGKDENVEAKVTTKTETKEEKEKRGDSSTEAEIMESKDGPKSEVEEPEKDCKEESAEERSQPISSAAKNEQQNKVKQDNLVNKDPVGEGAVADNSIPSGGGSVPTNIIPKGAETESAKLVPVGVKTGDSNPAPPRERTVDTNLVPTGVGTVNTNFIPSELSNVRANIVPTDVGSGLIPMGIETVGDSLIPTREGMLGTDVLTVEKDILEIIEKEISLPDKERLHFHDDNVDIFEKKEDLIKNEERSRDNKDNPVDDVTKSDAEDSKTEDEMKKPEVKQTKRKGAHKKEVQPSRRSNRISESIQKKEIEAAVKKAQKEMLREREEQERLEREEEEKKKKEEEEKMRKEVEEAQEKEDESKESEESKEDKEKESPKKKTIKKKEKTHEAKSKEAKKSKDQDEKQTEHKSKEQPDSTHKDKAKKTATKKQSTEKTEERRRTKSESETTLFAVGVDHEVYSKVKHKRQSTDNEASKEKEEKHESSSSEDEKDSDDEAMEEDDSDYDPEYDPERLWCICRKPHGNRFMICCDSCEEWLHGDCVSITKEIGKEMEKNGIEYVCPRCVIAKKKLKEQGIDPNKDKPENAPRRRRHRRLKIPGEKHHRHSADSTTKTKKSKREGHEKKPKEEKETSENKRKSIDTSSFYKIPKKVRTTPTPASFSSRTQRKCINSGCDNTAETQSVYCSDKCITKHAQEAINLLHEERKKRAVSSHKPATSHSSGINVPMPWESQQTKTPTSPQVKERVAVIERSTGRVIAGVAAPAEQDLVQWLHRHPTFEVIKPSVSKEVRKKDKKEEEKAIRDNVKRTLKDILSSRLKEVPELKLSTEDITRFSINIEEDLYKLFGEAGPRYKSKYRSLAFNLKDFRNKVLFHHVLSGEVPTDKLVGMTAEQLASQELARWRERETKHTIEMIKQNQLDINASKGHIKKTHKGEIELDEDEDLSSLEAHPSKEKENSEVAEPDSNTSPGPLLIDTTDQHRIHLFDLNCRICTGKIQPPGEPPRQEDMLMLVSTTTPIQALAESSVPSPPPVSVDITSVSSTDSYDTGSVSPPAAVKPAKRDKPVWKGYVMMQSVSKFSTNAYKVSGPCDDLLHLLPDTLHLQGRIGFKQVWGYIEQLRHSTTRDVSIVRYEVSSDDEKTSYVSLYSYFYSRKRCGVVSNCYTGVKDMYLVPLASHASVPSQLLPFDGPGLEEPRPHMLLGVIVRTKAHFKRPRPVHHRSGSSPTPKRRHGSSRSSEESQPKDSPPREIEDIVFYNKRSSVETKPAVSVSPSSGSSEHSSTLSSPSATSASVSETSAEKKQQSHKEELQDLADRAKQYIATALKAKQKAQQKDTESETKPEETKPDDEDKPYDPEEDFDLDFELEKPIDDKKPSKTLQKSSDVSSSQESSSSNTDTKNTDKETSDTTTIKTTSSQLSSTASQSSTTSSLDSVSSSTPALTLPSLPPSIFMPISTTVATATSASSTQPLVSSSQLPKLSIPTTDLVGIVKLLQQANSTVDTHKLPIATAPPTVTRDTREDHHRGATEGYRRPSGEERGGRPTDIHGSTTETERQRIDRERLEWRERRQSKDGPRDHGVPHDDRWRDHPRDNRGPPQRRVSDERYQGDYRGSHPGRGRYQPYHRDDRRGDRRGDRRDDSRWREKWRR